MKLEALLSQTGGKEVGVELYSAKLANEILIKEIRETLWQTLADKSI